MFENLILNRFVIALALLLAGWGLYWLFTRVVLLRARRTQALKRTDLPGYRQGGPAILYFTTPDCAVCKTMQKPALQRVSEMVGERLQILEINAEEHPDLADRWGVLSVPTTFILDSTGQPQQVNYGAAGADKLIRQLHGLLPQLTSGRLAPGDRCG